MKVLGAAVLVALVASATSSAGVSRGGAELLVVGPVESIDAENRTATVLGQRIHSAMVDTLAVGNSVAVFGAARADGAIEASAIQTRGLYVAGASNVFLSGTVQRADVAVGRAVVNGVNVDLTPAMSGGTLSPAVGSKVAISGIQPSSRGVVLVAGIAGTGAAVDGIAGTGSAVSGIAGTGSAVSGIAGTGSSVSGIAGTGSAVRGIAGTGYRVNGIAGTGFRVNGIAGTGSAVSGIAGTGSAVSGIAGTGSAVSGIAGTGSAVSGIAGTGSAVSGIAGTGSAVNGIAGTGSRANGIAGTGSAMSRISRSGAAAGAVRPQ
jgi:hypothetical protein